MSNEFLVSVILVHFFPTQWNQQTLQLTLYLSEFALQRHYGVCVCDTRPYSMGILVCVERDLKTSNGDP